MELIKKLNWRWIMMLAAVMMMGVTMTACGDDEDEASRPHEYVGVWAYAEDLAAGHARAIAVELDADGTGRDGEWDVEGEFFVPEDDSEGEWSIDGENLTLVTVEGNSRTCRFVLSDDGRYGTMYDDGEVIVYVKVR